MSAQADLGARFSIWLTEKEIEHLCSQLVNILDKHPWHENFDTLKDCYEELSVASSRNHLSTIKFSALSIALGRPVSVPVKLSEKETCALAESVNLPISLMEKIIS